MGLLDVLQSASNAVAGNVAGPVDLLSFLLRKGGVPVPEDALGGSEWMKRKGLMRDVPKGAEQVVGETLGLLAPTAIAANAPKIARGLLQAQANAAAPKTLHPETGAIVWHGSPHKFDKFDASKIGTGEGAQAYGHGIYVADSPGVAKSYRDALSGNSGRYVERQGQRLSSAGEFEGIEWLSPKDMAARLVAQHDGNVERAVAETKSLLKYTPSGYPKDLKQKALRELQRNKLAYEGATWQEAGALYKVDLPDELIPRMLDWDKPLSQQSETAQRALRGLADVGDSESTAKWLLEASNDPHTGALFKRIATNLPGADKTANFPGSARLSEELRQAGIPGIRYLDANSRGPAITYDVGAPAKDFGPYSSFTSLDAAKQHLEQLKRFGFKDAEIKTVREPQTSNFVIFPGLEDQLKILERNGVPLGLLTP